MNRSEIPIDGAIVLQCLLDFRGKSPLSGGRLGYPGEILRLTALRDRFKSPEHFDFQIAHTSIWRGKPSFYLIDNVAWRRGT